MKFLTKMGIGVLVSAAVIGLSTEILTPYMTSNTSAKKMIQEILAEADVQINGNRPWDIQVHDEAMYSRILRDGTLGFGETYMEGMWDSEKLDESISRLIRGKVSEKAASSLPMILLAVKAKVFNLQNKSGSMEVIDQHYQIGNDLYKNMLDPTLAYSCGYWKNAPDLCAAQEAKYDLICKKLGFKPGMRVLDIGCGWGGFAKHAAKNYGVEVVGITLSENQAEQARVANAGLPVTIIVKDYRDMHDSFDRILEIGMFEHVGEKNYREFMEVVHRNLKDDGMFLLHTIGSNISVNTTDPWIDKYIFPNGHLPSVAQIGQATEGLFVMEDWHNFGPDYDKTLLAWYDNYSKNKDKLADKPSVSFDRMWKYYLLSCAGCFRARDIQLWQVVFSKNGVSEGYNSTR